MSIHSTAIVDASARLGANVSIGPFAVIGPDVVLGDGCSVAAHAVIEYATLGRECSVFPQACLGLAPQHLKYQGEKTRLEVGDRCVFREGVTAHRGTTLDQGVTRVGNDGYFMAFSHIAHDCRLGNGVILANAALLAGHVEVGDNAFISALAGMHQFVRIGKGSIVSGGSMVSLDVAPYCIAQGDRAELRGLNVVGMRRAGFDRGGLKLMKEAYRTAFLSGLALKDALAHSALRVDHPAVSAFRTFLEAPKRGFARPPADAADDVPQAEMVS